MTKILRRYGWKPQKPDSRDRVYAGRPSGVLIPPTMDMRSMCPPVYDQGSLGACTAHAIAGAIDFERNKQGMSLIYPSRLFIYANERIMEGTDLADDSGAEIRDGIKSVVQQGVCPESEWQYDTTKFNVKPPAQCYEDASKELVLQYNAVYQPDLITALAGGYPVVFGFTVYDSFESEALASTGIMPMPAAGEASLGGHAVMAAGYDLPNQFVWVRNSWGVNWGIGGYFKMPLAFITDPAQASDFWVIKKVG